MAIEDCIIVGSLLIAHLIRGGKGKKRKKKKNYFIVVHCFDSGNCYRIHAKVNLFSLNL